LVHRGLQYKPSQIAGVGNLLSHLIEKKEQPAQSGQLAQGMQQGPGHLSTGGS
jgi:hypothetical protein